MFTASLENEDSAELAFGWAVIAVRQGAERGVRMGVSEGANEARRGHTFRNRTGALEQSIVGQFVGWKGNEVYGRISARKAYASYVDGGTRPHEIRIRRARWLHWEEPQGDHHFAKVVQHPGTSPRPFMHLAYYKAERVVVREIEVGIAFAQEILDA